VRDHGDLFHTFEAYLPSRRVLPRHDSNASLTTLPGSPELTLVVSEYLTFPKKTPSCARPVSKSVVAETVRTQRRCCSSCYDIVRQARRHWSNLILSRSCQLPTLRPRLGSGHLSGKTRWSTSATACTGRDIWNRRRVISFSLRQLEPGPLSIIVACQT
jgi:hypothetical protein